MARQIHGALFHLLAAVLGVLPVLVILCNRAQNPWHRIRAHGGPGGADMGPPRALLGLPALLLWNLLATQEQPKVCTLCEVK